MPPKREQSITVRLSDDEAIRLRQCAVLWGMDVTDVLRACLALGLPILRDVDYVRRVRLEDNKDMRSSQ